MTEDQYAQMKSATEAGLARVGLDLREALVPIIREIAGPSPRPSRLAERLEIDNSLASKLSRAHRTEDPLEFMHIVPAPAGLRIFLSAAARANVSSPMRTNANRSVRRFQDREIPDKILEALLDAANNAPTGGNMQPYSIIVVRNAERRQAD